MDNDQVNLLCESFHRIANSLQVMANTGNGPLESFGRKFTEGCRDISGGLTDVSKSIDDLASQVGMQDTSTELNVDVSPIYSALLEISTSIDNHGK